MESNAEIRGKIEAYKDILNQSNSLPQQKLIEYCQEKLTSELKKLHSRTVSNSKG